MKQALSVVVVMGSELVYAQTSVYRQQKVLFLCFHSDLVNFTSTVFLIRNVFFSMKDSCGYI